MEMRKIMPKYLWNNSYFTERNNYINHTQYIYGYI